MEALAPTDQLMAHQTEATEARRLALRLRVVMNSSPQDTMALLMICTARARARQQEARLIRVLVAIVIIIAHLWVVDTMDMSQKVPELLIWVVQVALDKSGRDADSKRDKRLALIKVIIFFLAF